MHPLFLVRPLRIRNSGATTRTNGTPACPKLAVGFRRRRPTASKQGFKGRGRSHTPLCPHATSQPFTTESTSCYSSIACTRARSRRSNGASTSSRPQSASCAPQPSTSRAITCYSEISLRKCRRCGRRTRDLAAVLTPAGWRELCFWCRQPNLWEAGRIPP